MEWLVVVLVIALLALGAFTVYRLVRSWRTAHAKLFDPPHSGSA